MLVLLYIGMIRITQKMIQESSKFSSPKFKGEPGEPSKAFDQALLFKNAVGFMQNHCGNHFGKKDFLSE